jgi:hypothetical protein
LSTNKQHTLSFIRRKLFSYLQFFFILYKILFNIFHTLQNLFHTLQKKNSYLYTKISYFLKTVSYLTHDISYQVAKFPYPPQPISYSSHFPLISLPAWQSIIDNYAQTWRHGGLYGARH